MNIKVNGLGWKPDLPDFRDKKYKYAIPALLAGKALPASASIFDRMPGPYNQGNTNSCTGHAGALMIEYLMAERGLKPFTPSATYLYFNARRIDGRRSTHEDGGASIRDLMKGFAQWGVCDDNNWPLEDYAINEKPEKSCYDEGTECKPAAYHRIETFHELKSCIAERKPVIFGMTVYESFLSEEVKNTGTIGMPADNERLIGGHCVLAGAYDDTTKLVTCQNSWGPEWGNQGRFTLPYSYIADNNLATDFWTVDRLLRTITA